MSEGGLSLLVSPERQSQLFAHLSTYLLNANVFPVQLQQKAILDLVQAVAYRLGRVCGDERQEMRFPLSAEEIQAVKEALQALELQYERWSPGDETSVLALEHLAACRLLIEQAEHDTHTHTEKEEGT